MPSIDDALSESVSGVGEKKAAIISNTAQPAFSLIKSELLGK